MLIILSPAKSLKLDQPYPKLTTTQPQFLSDAKALAQAACALSPVEIAKLMDISDKLADLNAGRFRAFKTPFTADNARPAIYCFAGDVYQGFDAATLDSKAIAYAQDHVRILSGLYGLLRPLDLMQAYRLEMGTRFGIKGKKDLYAYWGARLGQALADELKSHKSKVLLNLASQEYAKAVDMSVLPGPVVDVDFRQRKNGKLSFSSFAAKRMRGAMARFVCEERIDKIEALKDFDDDGYAFAPNLSDEHKLCFVKG